MFEEVITIWVGEPYLSKAELKAVLFIGMERFEGQKNTKSLRANITSYCDKRIRDFEDLDLFYTKKYRAIISKKCELSIEER